MPTPTLTSNPNPARFLPLLLILFAGSGCSALIYEIVWYPASSAHHRFHRGLARIFARHIYGRLVHRQHRASAPEIAR